MIVAAAAVYGFYVRLLASYLLVIHLLEFLWQVIYLLPAAMLGRVILRKLSPDWVNSSFGVATSAALGLGVIGFATFALSLAGWLDESTAWGVLVGAIVIGLLDARNLASSLSGAGARLSQWLNGKSKAWWMWVVSAALFTIPIIGATLIPGTLWRPDDPHPYDSLVYHLQVPREWYELGRMTPLKHNVYSFFPFNVEMHYLLANYLRGGPYVAMHQNQFLSLSFTLLAAIGVWGWLKRHGAGIGASLAAMTILTMPWILMLACVTYVESGMVLWGGLAICWMLNAIRGDSRPMGSFALAGALTGLVCGSKLTGVPMLLFGLPLAALMALAVRRFEGLPFKRFVVGCIVFGAVGMAVLSPWLIRNQAWAGNPLFPLAMRQLGQAHFSDTQVERFEIAHRAAADHSAWPVRFERLGSQVLLNWRFNYVVFPLALASAILLWRRSEALLLIVLVGVTGVFWLTVTHLMGRFFVLAIVPSALLIGLLPRKWLLLSGVLVAIAAINSWVGVTPGRQQFANTGNLHQIFGAFADDGRQGLFFVQDYSELDPPELREKMKYAREIVLVGDTQVFYRQIPMKKIRYCTVFDLNTEGDRDIFDAYYGPPPAKCPWDVLLLIDETETRRLSRTYWKVPEVPEPEPGRFREYATVKID